VTQKRTRPWIFWTALGLGLVVLAGGVGVFALTNYLAKRPGMLLVELPEDDVRDLGVTVDGESMAITAERPFQIEAAPGTRQIVVQRRGYVPYETAIKLEPAAEILITPQWQEVSANAAGTNGEEGLGSVAIGSEVIPTGYEGWTQNWEEAKRQAADRDKFLLVAFVTSDVDRDSTMLQSSLFAKEEFRQWSEEHCIRMVVDVPFTPTGAQRVTDGAQNAALVAQYLVRVTPTLMWMDKDGRPFGVNDELGATTWDEFHEIHDRVQREYDEYQAARDASLGDGEAVMRLEHAVSAVNWVKQRRLSEFYLDDMIRLAQVGEQLDGDNAAGKFEVLYAALWETRLADAIARERTDECRGLIDQLRTWRKERQVQDEDLDGRISLATAVALATLGDRKEAADEIRRASKLNIADEMLRERLEYAADLFSGTLSTGTGFLIASGGYVITNYHVIAGAGTPKVRMPDSKETLPVKVIAKDEARDMAILQADDPRIAALPPAKVSIEPMGRGVAVAAFGFPLGDEVGEGLKLTQGTVSGLPEPSTEQMYLLDMRINPGNSGGPLCDRFGRVTGMVTAKSYSDIKVDSYGIALPAKELHEFAAEHIPSYVAAEPVEDELPLDWAQVDRRVSPAVFMVLMVEE
jgi:hypothetical protein